LFKKNFSDPKYNELALELLKDVVDTLNEENIAYYLDFGTLLGIIREKRLIPWDNDLDISILKEEDYKKIPKVLEKIKNKYKYSTKIITFKESNEKRVKENKKIYFKNLDFTDENNFQIAKIKNKQLLGLYSIRLDIFFKYENNGYLNFVVDGQKYKIPKDSLNSGLDKVEFNGYIYNIPKDYKQYLTNIYDKWEKPDKNWHIKDSTLKK